MSGLGAAHFGDNGLPEGWTMDLINDGCHTDRKPVRFRCYKLPPEGQTMTNHSPEPWVEGCWEQQYIGGKLYYVFRTQPTDVHSQIEIYTGVKDGDKVHCSDFKRTRANQIPVVGTSGSYSDTILMLDPVDRRRIVACINAMKGIEDPEKWMRERFVEVQCPECSHMVSMEEERGGLMR